MPRVRDTGCFGAQGGATGELFVLVAQTNAQRTRSASEIAIGTHRFEFSDCVTDFGRADLWSVERNHFSELTGGDEFHRSRSEH